MSSHDNTILGLEAKIESLRQQLIHECCLRLFWHDRACQPAWSGSPEWDQLAPATVRDYVVRACEVLGGEFLEYAREGREHGDGR